MQNLLFLCKTRNFGSDAAISKFARARVLMSKTRSKCTVLFEELRRRRTICELGNLKHFLCQALLPYGNVKRQYYFQGEKQ